MRSGVKVWLLSVLTAGCFTDIPTESAPMMIGHTDGEPCAQGSSGCACYGNGTCDDGLGCAEAENVCVPSGCEPGTKACLCDNGDCEGGLVCVGAVCREPGQDGSGSASSTQGHTSTSGAGDTSSGAEAGSTTDPEEDEESDGSSDETGPDVQCDNVDCSECADCVVKPEAACGDLAAACEKEPGCLTAAACMVACGVEGICFDNCCEGTSDDAMAAAEALNLCRSDYCTAACGEYPAAQCV